MVLITFTICWWPFLSSAKQVLSRLAPFERGLYEDYVANFWCGTSMLIKWKQLFSIPVLARLALGATVTAALPSMVHQILAPSAKGFLLAMLNGSFAFYLFAFQVHEKSVLLPLLPATLLALEEPGVSQWLMPYAVISMFPLLRRDGLILPYFALLALFFLLPKSPTRESSAPTPFILKACSIVGALVLHLLYLFVQPPTRYPFLFEAFLTSYSFAHFVVLVGYTNWKQWLVPADDEWVSVSKKIN
jgi:alpha-1,3-glucosyltransferase